MTKKEKLKRLPHMLSGGVILLHAVERLETGHHTYWFFFIAAAIFFGIAVFHHKIAAKIPWVDIVFYSIEGILAFIIAYEYYGAGKKGLPIAYVFAGLMQIVAIIVFARKNKTKH